MRLCEDGKKLCIRKGLPDFGRMEVVGIVRLFEGLDFSSGEKDR